MLPMPNGIDRFCKTMRVFACVVFAVLAVGAIPAVLAEERVLIAYGGHNETVAPMWVGIEKGLFKKHGLDVRMLQVLKKNLRLAAAEDVEASYKVLHLMTTLDVSPNSAAWETMQRIVSRLNPKVGQVDLSQVLNGSFVRSLEESGFLPEMRKKRER